MIASERNPVMSESFDANDYRQVIAILQSYYNIIITDCGTGVVNSAMEGARDGRCHHRRYHARRRWRAKRRGHTGLA